MSRRFCTMLVMILVGLMLASTVSAQRQVTRRKRANAPQKKIGLSIHIGQASPNGDFSDASLGNHSSTTGFNVEGEYYFNNTTSFGLSVQGYSFEDKTFPEWNTDVTVVGAYVRYVAATGSSFRPFFRLGLGITGIEFDIPPFKFEADPALGVFAGVGVIVMVAPSFSVNGELGYNFTNTEETEIQDTGGLVVVGFKTSFVTINGGITFYIPL